MGIGSKAEVKRTTSPGDWHIVRECFVRSFCDYPAYKRLIQDDSKRETFLRAYLNANYDALVGNDRGILLVVKVPSDDTVAEKTEKDNHTNSMKIVGGCLILRPSLALWSEKEDEVFYKSYEKHKLAKISPKDFQRLLRYEKWESEQIDKKLARGGVRAWSGLFCAVQPEYACQGIGSAVYSEAAKLVGADCHHEKSTGGGNSLSTASRKTIRGLPSLVLNKKSTISPMLLESFFCKRLQPSNFMRQSSNAPDVAQPRVPGQYGEAYLQPAKITGRPALRQRKPVYMAVSHSDKAAKFHTSNGFEQVTCVPYYDEDGSFLFNAHVLIMDWFHSGQLELCTQVFLSSVSN